MPVVTCAALRRLSNVKPEDSIKGNYLLLEWTFAVLLHMQCGHRILPIFVGADNSGADAFECDLFQARPPRVGDDGKLVADNQPLGDRMPHVTVKAVLKKLRQFYKQHGLDLPPEAEELTVAEVVEQICESIGLTTWESSHAQRDRARDKHEWGLHEWLAKELVKPARSTELCAWPNCARPAEDESDIKTIQSDMKDIQAALRRGSADRKQLLSGLREVGSDVKAILQMSEAHFKLLSTLMKGVDKLAPKLICFLPVVEYKKEGKVKGWLSTLKSPGDWFNQRVRIFFIDPITLTLAETNGGKGFELDFPKLWVAKAMPYVKLGLTLLKVAAVAGKLAGIPIPDVEAVAGEWVDAQLKMLTELKGDAIDAMASMTKDRAVAVDLLNKVDQRCHQLIENKFDEARAAEGSALSERLHVPLEKSLKELDALLKATYPDWKDKCGLVLATARDGTSEWVLPEHKDKFCMQGEKAGGTVAAAGNAIMVVDKAASDKAAAEPTSAEGAMVTPPKVTSRTCILL